MPFAKGTSGNPSGKPKGTLSKDTIAFKTALMLAFDKNGGWKALAKWGKKNPTEFYKLMAKLIPVELTGANGSPLVPTVLRIIAPAGTPPLDAHGFLERQSLNGHANGELNGHG